MLTDRYGYLLTTASPAARDAYVEGVDAILAAADRLDEGFRRVIEADEGFALAHIGLARALQMTSRGHELRAPLDRALALAPGTTPREQAHIAIFERILTGRGGEALDLLVPHLAEWPRDAMALAPATGVFGLYGFSGRAGREEALRELLEGLAGDYGEDWWFLTVLAFAEIETGLLDRGRANVDRAMDLNPRNANAAHYKAHLHYEAGERGAGLAFLDDWAEGYPRGGLLHCHVSWHRALWSLETGDRATAWAIYSDALAPGAAWGPPINVLTDCASFLCRAEIAGETRRDELWSGVADYARTWFPNSGIAFADMHSALAFAMAGDGEALSRIVESPKGAAADMLAAAAAGLGAFARQDWAGAALGLTALLDGHERLGGSRAQRDLLDYAATCALLRGGRVAEARALIARRRPELARTGVPIEGLSTAA